MTPKKVKYETKQLGYFITANTLFWVNIVIGYYLKAGNISAVVDIVKYLGILGVSLLLGRKFMSDLIVRMFGPASKK